MKHEGKSMIQIISEIVENSTFCYSKPGGSGYVDKADCECSGKDARICSAFMDWKKFHAHLAHISHNLPPSEILQKRNEIVSNIRHEFKESQWYKDNIVDVQEDKDV